jgi:hypothetical protein
VQIGIPTTPRKLNNLNEMMIYRRVPCAWENTSGNELKWPIQTINLQFFERITNRDVMSKRNRNVDPAIRRPWERLDCLSGKRHKNWYWTIGWWINRLKNVVHYKKYPNRWTIDELFERSFGYGWCRWGWYDRRNSEGLNCNIEFML